MSSEEEQNAVKFFNECITKDHLFEEDFTLYNMKILVNLITKLQKENEYWKNGFERELEDNRKNTCELLKQDLILREKDKQIDLMGEYISKYDTDEDICEEQAPLGCDEINREVDCKECIKQYFEKLAKEKKEDIKNKTSTK